MDAWEFDEIEARRADRGVLYEEFLRVPDLSAGIYVLEAGAHGPAVAAHRGRAVLRRPRPGPGDGRRRRARRGPRLARLRRGPCPAQVPRHHRAARAARVLRAGRGRPRLTRHDLGLGPPRRRRHGARARVPGRARLVVAEEHEHIEAVGQERLEPGRPGREVGRRVVVASQPQVEERARPPDGRRRPRPRAARSCTARRPPPASAANVSSTCQLGSWNSSVSGRSRGQAARSAASRASSRFVRVRDAEQHRARAAPRTRGTGRSATGRPGLGLLERAERPAALRLDREPEAVAAWPPARPRPSRPTAAGRTCC